MVTSIAPRRRASSMNGQRWTLELTMFAPQATMRRECTTASGSKPMALPSVVSSPLNPALAQIVRSRRLAPSAWKKRRSMLPYERRPMLPAYE
jgi:hypothetical protein